MSWHNGFRHRTFTEIYSRWYDKDSNITSRHHYDALFPIRAYSDKD